MASNPTSLAAAVAHGQPLFSSVTAWLQGEGAEGLPKSLAAIPRAPISWADAQAAVQARDDDKRRRAAGQGAGAKPSKSKGFNSNSLNTDQPAPQPGATIGSVTNASTFWMFVVSEFAHRPGVQTRHAFCATCPSIYLRLACSALTCCALVCVTMLCHATDVLQCAVLQEDYFREVSKEDLLLLIPHVSDISQVR